VTKASFARSATTSCASRTRAAPAGEALCRIGGKEAERLVLAGSELFGDAYWERVAPCLKMTGVPTDWPAATARELLERGFVRETKGDIAGALADYTEATAKDPRDAFAWARRAALRMDQGDREGAVKDATRALEFAPRSVPVLAKRGEAWFALDRFDRALADFDAVLVEQPRDVRALANRGAALLEMVGSPRRSPPSRARSRSTPGTPRRGATAGSCGCGRDASPTRSRT
jgi:tetratricopeptide (TPR) repeat protein